MTFATQPTAAYEGVTASGTSHPVPMPASDVQAGDGLLVLARALLDFNSTPAGWTELHEYTPGSMRTAAYYKIADGTEDGTSPVWGTATSGGIRYHVWHFRGVHASSIAESFVNDAGTLANPDCPSLTPSWAAAEDVTWVVQLGTGNGRTPTAPANYAGLLTSNATQHSCYRDLNAASEDPGAWALAGGTSYCVVHTIAVRPAAGGGAPAPIAAKSSYFHLVGGMR